MNDEQTRAKTNLDNLREDLIEHQNARAAHVAGIAHEDGIIALRKADIERAERHLEQCRWPVYDRVQGMARRIIAINKRYIVLRYDLGKVEQFRISDGALKCSHCRGERIDSSKAIRLWNHAFATKAVVADLQTAQIICK